VDYIAKSYYAVIPASVRYDAALSPNAKLLYGEISALCNEKGYCWASNDYFAQLYDVHKNTISIWINVLAQRGHIIVVIDKDNGNGRQIRIAPAKHPINENAYTYQQKQGEGINEKIDSSQRNQGDPINENLKHNITLNTTENSTASFESFWRAYPRKVKRPAAACAWSKLNPDSELAVKIICAVERARRSEQWTEYNGKFIPYPATYLNQRRWEDEIEVSAQPESEIPQPRNATDQELRLYFGNEHGRTDITD
jgi:hypothetical protein